MFSIFFQICFVWAPCKTCSDCVSHHHLSFFVSNLGAVFNGLAHVTLWGQASYAQYNDHDIFVFFWVKCRCCFLWFSSCNPVRVSSFRPKKRPRLLTQKIEPRDFRHLTKKWGPTFYPLSTCSAFLFKFCFVWAPWLTCSDCFSLHLSFFGSNVGAVFYGLAHVTLWGLAFYAQKSGPDICP